MSKLGPITERVKNLAVGKSCTVPRCPHKADVIRTLQRLKPEARYTAAEREGAYVVTRTA